MKKFFRRISMVPTGLRYKLMIAFSLMSIIPLLVCVYLASNFIFPHTDQLANVSVILLICVGIALLGLNLARRLVEPVINLALETKIIASGDYKRQLEINRDDEIGELGNSINLITKQIKSYMFELQDYSVRTKEVNIEIQKRVLALTNLLHIGDMIATSEKLEKILNIVTEKANEIEEENFAILFLSDEGAMDMVYRSSFNMDKRGIKNLVFNIEKDDIGVLVKEKNIARIDSSVKPTPQTKKICDTFLTSNYLIVPIVLHGRGTGFLMTGNDKDDFEFKDDDVDLIKVLCKQLAIAIENDRLSKRTKELAIKDDLTDLYNEKYIKGRLHEEIDRAVLYQRPCSLLLFNIDNFRAFRDKHGEMVTEECLKTISVILKEGATEIGKVSRVGGDEFAIVLPEKNKKEATQVAEEMRRKIEAMEVKGMKKSRPILTVSGGVSENPIDGTSTKELFEKAAVSMKRAKLEGKNRIAT